MSRGATTGRTPTHEAAAIGNAVGEVFQANGIRPGATDHLARFHLSLAEWIEQLRPSDETLTVAICGAPGSGKSSLTAALASLFRTRLGLNVAALSLDDLYLSHERRKALAARIHPLLATRGVPGTHDIDAGIALLDSLASAPPSARTMLPGFDKATDNPVPPAQRQTVFGRPDIVLFEGWCVRALPQAAVDLVEPLNRLEAEEDRDGSWRGYVNEQLGGPYQMLFGRTGPLLMLAAPSFEIIRRWRGEQEAVLARRVCAEDGKGPAVMTERALDRFIMHYERLIRHSLQEMPERADAMVRLDADRTPNALRVNAAREIV